MTKIGNFQIKTLCYESCWNENFVCKSCCPGSIAPCTVNHFHICWETKTVEQFLWGMYWTKKTSSLVTFLAIREAVLPLANYPIMLGRLIRSFRHLEHQNPSIISDSKKIIDGCEKKWGVGGGGNLIHIEEDKDFGKGPIWR